MKESLIRARKIGIPTRGKIKNRPEFKSHENPSSEDHDASNLTDNLSTTSSNSAIAAAGELDEAESNHPVIPPPLENSGDLSDLPIVVATENILAESPEAAARPEDQIIKEKSSEKDEEERNLEVELAGFSTAMEKLCDAIAEVLLPVMEQRKRRRGRDGFFFFLARFGEITLAFVISALLVFHLVTVAVEISPEFNGPTPT